MKSNVGKEDWNDRSSSYLDRLITEGFPDRVMFEQRDRIKMNHVA